MELVATAKKWGSSLGVIIPKDAVDDLGLREDDTVRLRISKAAASDALRKTWGISSDDKKTAQEWKDEFRRTLYKEHY